jgi:hypothetical protein
MKTYDNPNQAKIDSLKTAIANLTKKMADPNFSATSVKVMENLRQRHYAALKILEKTRD